MKVTITNIFREQRTSKAGKPFESVRIKTQEHGERWISGFGNAGNKDWKQGDEVEITLEEKGQYLNFKNDSPRGGAGMKEAILIHMDKQHREVMNALEVIKDMIADPEKRKEYSAMKSVNDIRNQEPTQPNFEDNSLTADEIPF